MKKVFAGENMTKLSKKVKAWVVVSIVWFLLVCAFAAGEAQYRADPLSYYGNTESGFDIGEFLTISIVFNIPLVIGWGIWWVKRD